jgi:hypothetical protein
VGDTTIAADSVTDTLTLAGSNVTITPDATNDKVTIGITKANVTSALGYTPPTSNTTYTAGTGLTLSSTEFSISKANVSTIVNLLDEGTSPAEADDYLVAQYAGGGTTNKTYYRRKVSNVVNAARVKAALGTTSGTSKYLREDGTWGTPPNTNTKNTAGSTDSSEKLFLIGATEQSANPQTYSHDTAYVGTDGLLYSGSKKVSTEGHTHSVTYKKSATSTSGAT